MKKKDVERTAEKVLDWCANKVGFSKFYESLPILEVEYEGARNIRGEFDSYNNVITVYIRANPSLRLLVMTVMHEFLHYTQSPTWLDRYSKIYKGKLGKNPYENEAEKFAMTNCAECMRDLNLREKKRGKYNK